MESSAEFQLIKTLVVLLGVATAFAYVLQWFRLPSVLGFILCGILIGPGAFRLIEDSQTIHAVAQIGILFLLFIIGMELPISQLRELKRQAPLAGFLQLSLSAILITAFFSLTGMPLQLAFLLGSILSLSSTAIVLKNMEDIGEMDTVHGRLILGILIIQDLSTVPLMTLVPTLSSPFEKEFLVPILLVSVKAFLFLALAAVVSLKLLPALLDKLASTNSREIFILSVGTISLGMAFITGFSGLSYEAGAFIAGFSLSGSTYSRQAVADSRPFRDIFAALFFVSVGLMVDIHFLFNHWVMVLLVTALLVAIKFVATYISILVTGFPRKTALWISLSLFQVGEFSFILLGRLVEHTSQVVAWEETMVFWNPLLVNSIILSMFVTPIVIRNIPMFLYRISLGRRALQKKNESLEKAVPLPPQSLPLEDRVIIAGYGPITQMLVNCLDIHQLPYLIVEMNLNTIKFLRRQKINCLYGDITHPDILEAVNIKTAKILAITVPETRTAEVTLQHANQLNPNLYCIVRTRYRSHVDRLYALGADEVIYEELESSIGFLFNIFHFMGYPVETIEPMITRLRESEALNLREVHLQEQPVFGRLSLLKETKIEWIEIRPESHLAGKALSETGIYELAGISIIALVGSSGQYQVHPEADSSLSAHDILVVLGSIEQLHKLEMLAASGVD